jgi:hypothetical protein
MRIREAIIRICVAAGFFAAAGGILYAWQTDDIYVGTLWAIFGVGLMGAAGVYSLAMDDPQSRAKALGDTDHTDRETELVDVRDSTVEPPVQVRADYGERLTARR